ncbi:MAG: choice-of-anchor D domain-containing protein, partial [Burkholderiales bacterium]
MKSLFEGRLIALFIASLLGAMNPVAAQNANAGQALYKAILVPGNPSCASGGCHGPDPRDRQNKIQNGDTPGGIGFAISSVRDMSFLRGRLSATELTDLAAYIANPAAATGTPAISVSPPSISFRTTGLGASSAARTVTVSNPGTAALAISDIVSNSSDFVVSNSNCSAVAPAGSCSFNVTFRPRATGARTGAATISHNAMGATTIVTFSGIAEQPTLRASIGLIDFGFVAGDAPRPIRTVTITNPTSAPIGLTAI